MSKVTKYSRFRVLPVALTCLALASACAAPTHSPLVTVTPRSADVHPTAQRDSGVSLAVRDATTADRRLRSVWGPAFAESGILPIEVIVSNQGRDAVSIEPGDVFVLRGSETLASLSFDQVAELIEQPERVRPFALRTTIVPPGRSLQGILFFDVSDGRGWLERLLDAYPAPVSRVHVALTNIETQQRLRFGPFGFYR